MTNDDGATPASSRVPGPLVMPFANVRHLGFRDKVRAARLAAVRTPIFSAYTGS